MGTRRIHTPPARPLPQTTGHPEGPLCAMPGRARSSRGPRDGRARWLLGIGIGIRIAQVIANEDKYQQARWTSS